jgi:hypothetical protein
MRSELLGGSPIAVEVRPPLLDWLTPVCDMAQ